MKNRSFVLRRFSEWREEETAKINATKQGAGKTNYMIKRKLTFPFSDRSSKSRARHVG